MRLENNFEVFHPKSLTTGYGDHADPTKYSTTTNMAGSNYYWLHGMMLCFVLSQLNCSLKSSAHLLNLLDWEWIIVPSFSEIVLLTAEYLTHISLVSFRCLPLLTIINRLVSCRFYSTGFSMVTVLIRTTFE